MADPVENNQRGPVPHDDEPDIPATVEEALAARMARLSAKRTAAKPRKPATSSTPAQPKRRRHAALGSRGLSLMASIVVTAVMVFEFSRSGTTQIAAPVGIVTADSAASSTAAVPTEPTVINGDAFTNKWGPVQVQVTFGTDGTITDVQTLVTPSRDNTSVRINDRAVPVLP